MKKSARQLNREIAQALANPKRVTFTPSLRRATTAAAHARIARGPAKASHPAYAPSLRSAPPATTHARKKKSSTGRSQSGPSDKIDIDQLAKLLDLPPWENVDERNQHYYWELARGSEDEDAAERAAQDEVYGQWYDAVERAASKLLEEHDLELQPANSKDTSRPYQLKIVPSSSWNSSANKLRETINGVGTFHFNDLKEFLSSGPYTARQAVLSHLSWINRHPDVYGGQSARRLYDQGWP